MKQVFRHILFTLFGAIQLAGCQTDSIMPLVVVTPSASHVTLFPATAQTIVLNSTQAFSVTADAGYTVSSTVGSTCPAGSWTGTSYVTGAITADCTVDFSADANTYTVTPSVDSYLSSTPSGAQSVSYGGTGTFTLATQFGHSLNSTAGGTCPAGSFSGSTYTTGVITSNCTVSFSSSNGSLFTNLLGIWHLDGSGILADADVVADSSGNGNDATASISSSGFSYASASFSEGLTAQSSSSILDFGTSLGNFGTSDFSISLWMKTSSGTNQQILNKRSACSHQSMWNLAVNSLGKVGFEVDEDSSGTNYIGILSGPGYNDGNWHHLVAYRSGASTVIYLDGTNAVTGSASGTADISNEAKMELGNLPCTSQPFIGSLDELIVWTRALTSSEISELYSTTQPLIP